MKGRYKYNAGFTLIEMLMVITIIGIVAVIASSRLQNLPQTKASFAINKLQSDVRYAQLLAVESQARTRIVFDAAADTYALERETAPNTWTAVTNPIGKGSYTVTLNSGDYSGVDITAVTLNAASTVIFDSYGAPYDASSVALIEPANVELNAKYQLRFRALTGKVDIVTL